MEINADNYKFFKHKRFRASVSRKFAFKEPKNDPYLYLLIFRLKK